MQLIAMVRCGFEGASCFVLALPMSFTGVCVWSFALWAYARRPMLAFKGFMSYPNFLLSAMARTCLLRVRFWNICFTRAAGAVAGGFNLNHTHSAGLFRASVVS